MKIGNLAAILKRQIISLIFLPEYGSFKCINILCSIHHVIPLGKRFSYGGIPWNPGGKYLGHLSVKQEVTRKLTPQVVQTFLRAGQGILTNAHARVTVRVITHFDMSFLTFLK